jgi:hypothetical protein
VGIKVKGRGTKMGDEVTDPEIVEIDLEEVIGNILDARGLTSENLSKLDSLDSLSDSLEGLFKKHKTPAGKPVDTEGLLQSISDMVDEKLKGIATGGGKKNDPGWLSRILSTP